MGNALTAPVFPDDIKKILPTTREYNPGSLDEIHKRCKDVFPTNFDGAILVVARSLSNHFHISHTINLSHAAPSGYKFSTSYVGSKQVSPTEAFPILLGDIDPNGNMNASLAHQFLPRIRGKFNAQIQNSHLKSSQVSMEYKGNIFTAGCSLAEANLINGTGVAVLHYFQGITKYLALGTELACKFNTQDLNNTVAIATVAGRYDTDNWSFSATIGNGGFNFCYYQKASKQLQIGVQLETNYFTRHSQASIGYQVDLPKTNVIFRGYVDSGYCVGAVLEKRLDPLPVTLAFSGLMAHKRNQFRLGVGLIIG